MGNTLIPANRQIVTEFSIDMTDAVVFRINDMYELGIELPMDFSKIWNADVEKVNKLLNMNAAPVFFDSCSPKTCGKLFGKPALYIAPLEQMNERRDVIAWAHECVEKMANFDFAEYYLTHKYCELTNPNLNIILDEEDEIEDDLPFDDDLDDNHDY